MLNCWKMSDKEATAMENLNKMNPLVHASHQEAESEIENVDAIKKYIEEQEILLRDSSTANDLVDKIENGNMGGNQCNKNNSVSIDSEETMDSSPQSPTPHGSSLDSDSEDTLANEAAANLLSLSQGCFQRQTNIKDIKYSDEIIARDGHEEISNINAVPEVSNPYLNKDIENSEHIDLNNSHLSPKKIEEKQHLSIQNQNSLESEKSMLEEKSCDASDSEANSMPMECEHNEPPNLLHKLLTCKKVKTSETTQSNQLKNMKTVQDNKEHSEETIAIATSVMDMILNDAEAAISKRKVSNALSKQFGTEKANSSVSLAIGSKVEAKDFCELWHPAEIIEVDCEEMEVLVQYDNQPKKLNEWINISSPRLRPIGSLTPKPVSPAVTPAPEDNTEQKVEDKQKLTFAVGERCLARWRDNRRFIATVQNDLGNGHYEVMFDDGFQWKCTLSRMYKLKESSGSQEWAGPAACPSPPAPLPVSPATNGLPPPALPLYHTHLFDPTRDYLGSKSERREMKRKLNIKEIFNIGQKRKKLHTTDKEPKTTPISIKEEIKTEPITDAPHETTPLTIPALKGTSSAIQVKKAIKRKPPVKKKPLARKKIKLKPNTEPAASLNISPKKEIPEAVASIIGTVCKTEPEIAEVKSESLETKDSNANDIKLEEHNTLDELSESLDANKTSENLHPDDIIKEETELVKFDVQDGVKHEEVIDKIKEVITKLEDGINQVEKIEVDKTVEVAPVQSEKLAVADEAKPAVTPIATGEKEKSKKSSKVKKGNKLRLLQEKKVKKQVEKVKSQLEEMKKQVEEMRQQIMLKTEELGRARVVAAGEACLLPGEWCCRWVDGQPVGAVSEVECDAAPPAGAAPPLPRRSVQVEDKRLPPGWTKHMVRRSLGNSAGKWDVVLVSPENRRMHTKNDMRIYLENNRDEALKPYEAALMDFGIHLKLSRRMGWVSSSAEGAPPLPPPSSILANSSPLLKRKKLSLNKNHKHEIMHQKKRHKLKIKPLRPPTSSEVANVEQAPSETKQCSDPCPAEEATLDGASIKDGFVYVGGLKVQVIETLLRCPAEGCFKNFRNTMLLKMHIKHYHRELRKTMGNTPKVLDLAYARTRPTEAEMKRLKCEAQQRIVKVKLPRLHKKIEEPAATEPKEVKTEPTPEAPPATPATPGAPEEPAPKPQDSPKLRNALVNKPQKRPRVLLPVRSKEPEPVNDLPEPPIKLETTDEALVVPKQEIPDCEVFDFETAISSHTVPKLMNGKVKSEKKRKKTFARIPKLGASEDEEWAGAESDLDTRSSYPSCGTPDSKAEPDPARASSPSDDQKEPNGLYMYTETGERIKLVRMKREEIINCHCGFREEDGLMVQCELCLCWQHALCHNIQREAEVPEKYTCSICLNPRRGRRRQRFTQDQDRLYEGLLPGPGGGRASDQLRRAHELSGNLLRLKDALHALRVNTNVATTKNHHKLYLWARDWESVELSIAQEKLNSEYSDLNVIINNLGKENMPMKAEDLKEMALDIKTPSSDDVEEKHGQRESLNGSQGLLSCLLSSPGGVSLDLPISESELEKLAKSVQEHERVSGRGAAGGCAGTAPQPEAAIENSACRARLLRHLQRCHTLLDQRLDSIEAQVAELESQDASLEDDETADFYPRTKQTMVMIGRDLDTMEELGIVT